MWLKHSLALDSGSSCVLRIKASGVEVAVVVRWFLIQCGAGIAIATFHGGAQEINFLDSIFKGQFDGGVEVLAIFLLVERN